MTIKEIHTNPSFNQQPTRNMENTGIKIDRESDNTAYITFKRTGLVICVDDSTEEEKIRLWNNNDEYALPPANLDYVAEWSGKKMSGFFRPHSWKKETYREVHPWD